MKEIIRGGASARWHAGLYVFVAVLLILLAYETLATQSLNGYGLEFTVGSGYAQFSNQTDTPIRALLNSPSPFIVQSDDNTLRFDVNSKSLDSDNTYEQEVEIPSGEFNFRIIQGANVTFRLNPEAHARVTVVPYDTQDSMTLLTVIGTSILGSSYFAFLSLKNAASR